VPDGFPEMRTKADRDSIARIVAAQEQDTIDLALSAARERLGMDAVYVTTVTDSHQSFDVAAGEPGAVGLRVLPESFDVEHLPHTFT
jgi:hypothetical protein